MVLIDARPSGTAPVGGPGSGIDPFVQLAFVHDALDDLALADLHQPDDDWLAQLVKSTEVLKARIEAVTTTVADEIERRAPELREKGFFTTKSYLKHHGLLSGPEAHIRMQVNRMFDLLPDWKHTAHTGNSTLGVDQIRLMARVAANPRIHDALVAVSNDLLDDAQSLPYDVFEQYLRNFARLADPDATQTLAERNHASRDVTIRQLRDGSWRLNARFGSLQGAEIEEILAHHNHAEFETDWATAKQRSGVEQPAFSSLDRTEPQRRADALHHALLRAATSPTNGAAPLPCLNVLIDETTLETTITGAASDPSRYRTMVCRTQNGNIIDTTEAASIALFEHIRRVVHDTASVIIDLGRKSRLFRGNNRDAALLLTDRCIWPGCDRQVRHCQADHNIEWQHEGATAPDNANGMCGRHNRLKTTHRYRPRRHPDGTWTIHDPGGDPIT